MSEYCVKNLMVYGCQNVTILLKKKKNTHTVDFRERTGVESFEHGHDRRRNRFGSSPTTSMCFSHYISKRHKFKSYVRFN